MDTVDCSHWYAPRSGKEISSQSYTLHEAHCKRNYYHCECGAFLKLSLKPAHLTEKHVEKACPNCAFRAIAYRFDPHDCPNKPQECPYCEAQILVSEYPRHERECGTRTEQCGRCFKYIMKRGKTYVDWPGHEEVCGKSVEQPVRHYQNAPGHYDREMLRAQLRSEGVAEEEILAMMGPQTPSDSPPKPEAVRHQNPEESSDTAMLRAQLRSENVPEDQINAMLGEDPHAEGIVRPRPVVPQEQQEDSEESEPMEVDSIPSIDFEQFHQNLVPPPQTEAPPTEEVPESPHDFDVTHEERELNKAILKSLTEK